MQNGEIEFGLYRLLQGKKGAGLEDVLDVL